jgi:hypothetical protein
VFVNIFLDYGTAVHPISQTLSKDRYSRRHSVSRGWAMNICAARRKRHPRRRHWKPKWELITDEDPRMLYASSASAAAFPWLSSNVCNTIIAISLCALPSRPSVFTHLDSFICPAGDELLHRIHHPMSSFAMSIMSSRERKSRSFGYNNGGMALQSLEL